MPARPNGHAVVPSCARRPRPAARGGAAPWPRQRSGHGAHRDAGARGRLRAARPAGPKRAPLRPALPWRDSLALPASPHIIGVPARELADILVHVLEAFFGFLQLLLQRAHRHRHPARRAAWPGPAQGSAGKQGEQARLLRGPRAGTAQPIAPRRPPLNHQSPGTSGKGSPPGRLAKSAHQSQGPRADWHPRRPTSGRLSLLP